MVVDLEKIDPTSSGEVPPVVEGVAKSAIFGPCAHEMDVLI
jgi:hypothetical protein